MPPLDPDALYREHHTWLQRWLRSRLDNSADAADLAQDTFIRILLHRNRYEIQAPRALLRSIASGLMVDRWRRAELERAWQESLLHLAPHETPSPETREMALQLLERIASLLDGLRPRVRQAFLLAQCEGLTHPQIAERMGISLRSVERYVGEALFHCYQLRYADDLDG
ncbi:sigma-70 family RNA polymerase sigma factor [Azomonas macrocytogenes]|uniref:RNA polymerase sigma-70 factor (ECF subfamily) n=1 Tax=Azomonas macrocytogenes TaxID=69962 RepID=A0A839T157_AZOMA|nr:sigma-70 family RNA polymerase sigma factor [Azomonas macrocytogenes]MBB3102134.1 RNA polymerase sigma-70 factor (ECF subfamily) [Azomonas macrocytogenes]